MQPLIESIARVLFGYRKPALAIFALCTALLGISASDLKIDAGFKKQLPLDHPYIKVFLEYQEEFGGANRLLIAVRAVEGDIFTPELFPIIKKVTDEVFFLPGVNRSTVRSIFTPNERFIEIVEGGFSGGNLVPADFSPTPEQIAVVRENIIKAGAVGRLISNDFSAALVSAQLVEVDPSTNQKLDYLRVAELLEEKIRIPFENNSVDIHIIGFAKIMGDISEGARGVILFFFVAVVITALLVAFFIKSLPLTLLPLATSLVAVIWTIGLLPLLGFGIDPMSILVPFLVFAIGISHGVQIINRVSTEAAGGKSSFEAAKTTFCDLFIPGFIALLSDGLGFLVILVIDIPIIQELAVTASLGVLTVIFTNLALLPLLLTYITFSEDYRAKIHAAQHRRAGLWKPMCVFTEKKYAAAALGIALLLGITSYRLGQNLQIGDSRSGVPEFRMSSRYNQDSLQITSRFSIGIDILTVLVETIPNGCIEYDIMSRIDDFQWRLADLPVVQSTISLPQMVKIINAGWNEGNPKWRVIPRDSQTIVQSVGNIETSTGLLNSDCSVLPVIVFLKDHKASTLALVVDEVERYAHAHNSERARFLLATGNAGVMAATNQIVSASEVKMVLSIYLAVLSLCLITFRSITATLCIAIPLGLVSLLCNALMAVFDIGLKVTTLPIAALGVGVGVDYGIYLFGRLQDLLGRGMQLKEAYLHTLTSTGNAVLITGLTLSLGVATWLFSALKFQADMGLILSFLFLANMIGALILIPSLLSLFSLFKGRGERGTPGNS